MEATKQQIDLKAVEPEMNQVWGAFCLLSEGRKASERDWQWIKLVAQCVPGKDQLDFTRDDWAAVLDALRKGAMPCN